MMKRTPFIQQPMMGQKRNWIEYESATPSPFWAVWFPGMVECVGPADGSKLELVEKYGPGFHAKYGHEYPFNLIILQGVNGIGDFNGVLMEYLQSMKGCGIGDVFMWGWSRGGREVLHYFAGFQKRKTLGLVRFCISISGEYTPDAEFTFCGCVDIPLLCVASKADNDVKFIYSDIITRELNQCPGRKSVARLEQLTTENHAQVMQWATSTDPNSRVNKFIGGQLFPPVTPQPEAILTEYILDGYHYVETAQGKYKSAYIKMPQ